MTTTTAPTTAEALHQFVVDHVTDAEWDSIPEMLFLSQDGQMTMVVLAVDGDPTLHLQDVLATVAAGQRLKAVSFTVEAWRVDINPSTMVGPLREQLRPSENPDRIETRFVYTWDAHTVQAAFMDRGKGTWERLSSSGPEGGPVAEFGRKVQQTIAHPAV